MSSTNGTVSTSTTPRYALYKNRTYRIMRFARNGERVQLAFQNNLNTKFWVDTNRITEIQPGETCEHEAEVVQNPNPTPATPPAPVATSNNNDVTYPCTVEFGSGWTTVTNNYTGNSLTVEIGANSDLDTLSQEERTLMIFLLDPNADADVELAKGQLLVFRNLHTRLNQEPTQQSFVQQTAHGEEVVPSEPQEPTEPTEEEVQSVLNESQVDDAREEQIRRLEGLTRALKSASEDRTELVRIVYYIPSRVSAPITSGGRGMFGNLAGRMRAAGLIQFDGSTYCGKEGCIPSDVFAEMDEWNAREDIAATQFQPKSRRLLVRYKCEKIHPEQLEATRQEAFEQLRDHVVEIHLSLMDSVDAASKRLDDTLAALEASEEGATTKQLEAAHKRRIGNCQAAVSAARNRLKDALKAAQLFDETESLQPLFAGLRAAIESNNASVLALKRAIGSK